MRDEDEEKVPKSFVVKRGRVGHGIAKLVSDFRRVMLPYTALKLREKRTTRIKDFLKLARPMKVSHMLLFSQSDNGNAHLSVGCLPQGPTLTFRIQEYSLSSHVRILHKSTVNTEAIFHSSPLVILNNFDADDPQTKLVSTTFQNMFPSINVAEVKLAHCKRVVLYNYDKNSDSVLFRHFAITARPAGLSRSIRRLMQAKIPNLNRANDVSELVLANANAGAASDSEYEDETCQVTLADRFSGRGNVKNNQSAIKLVELGPRVSFRLVKVTQELFKGEVMYHAFVSKTDQEKSELKERAEQRRQRRLEQEANVKRKREMEEEKAKAKAEKRLRRKEKFEEERKVLAEAGPGALD